MKRPYSFSCSKWPCNKVHSMFLTLKSLKQDSSPSLNVCMYILVHTASKSNQSLKNVKITRLISVSQTSLITLWRVVQTNSLKKKFCCIIKGWWGLFLEHSTLGGCIGAFDVGGKQYDAGEGKRHCGQDIMLRVCLLEMVLSCIYNRSDLLI